MNAAIVPDHIRAAVEQQLLPDETLAWVGQPQRRRFRGEIRGEVALGAILAAVAITAAVGIGAALMFAGDWTVLFLIPVPLVFGWHGRNYLRAPLRYRRDVTRTIYAVTNRRAIVLNGFGFSRRMNLEACEAVQSHPLPSATIALRRRRDGTGDLVWRGERRGGGKHSRRYVEFGFFGVDDPDQVLRCLTYLVPTRGSLASERNGG